MNDNNLCLVCNKSNIYCKGMCRSCYGKKSYQLQKEQKAIYYRLHKKEINLRHREYYKSHRSALIDYGINYRKTHSLEIDIQRKEYRKLNPMIDFLGIKYFLKYYDRAPKGYLWHHTCYDHADPEAYIELLSISSHNQGHTLLRKLGIEIPHINMER